MITKAIKDAFKTFKNHFWMMIAMVVPATLITFVVDGLVSSVARASYASAFASWGAWLSGFTGGQALGNVPMNLLPNNFAIGLLLFIAGVIAAVLTESFLMGFLYSDEKNDFKFEHAFVAFTTGYTWLVAALYAVFMSVIEFLFGAFFAIVLVICGTASGLAAFGSTAGETAAVGIVALILVVAIIALWIFVGTGLAYIYLTYFDAKRNGKDAHVMQGFEDSWKLMKGHRWEIIGLNLLTFLIAFVGYAVLAIVSAILWGIFASMIGWNSFAALLVFIMVVLAIIWGFLIAIWFQMAIVKFYEEIKA